LAIIRSAVAVLLVDRRGDLAHRADDRAEGLAHPHAVHLADQVEELPLHLREEAHQPRREIAAAGSALQELERVERDRLAELRLQAAADQFRDEQLVHDRAHRQLDAARRGVHAFQRAGDAGDHRRGHGLTPGCS
jgi:hypothetical protein